MNVRRDDFRLLTRRGLGLLLGIVLAAAPAAAQRSDEVPYQLESVGVTERLGEQVPADLRFLDEDGREVRLGDYLERGRPVLLTLNYYRCAMLCSLQLSGLLDGLKDLEWTPGEQFEVVTVSIDPLETPTLARMKKQSYMKEYARPGAAQGWHFLTGREADIRRLADAVGFGYAYDESSGEYAHAASAMFLTPSGRIARYLYGIEYPSKQLRLALTEASEGTVGSPLDQLILYCFYYDPDARSYAPLAMNIMRLGGGLTVAVLGGVLGVFWLRDRRRRA